jgi:hypothetical protein
MNQHQDHHLSSAAEAVKNFERCFGSNKADAIADLISDLGHLADQLGLDFVQEVERGLGHWRAERGASVHAVTVDLT